MDAYILRSVPTMHSFWATQPDQSQDARPRTQYGNTHGRCSSLGGFPSQVRTLGWLANRSTCQSKHLEVSGKIAELLAAEGLEAVRRISGDVG